MMLKKTLFALLSASLLLWGISCSNDDNGSSSGGSQSTKNPDGTTTLNIQEGDKGFVSHTGVLKTEFAGWSGSGYLDGLTADGNVVYTVSAEEAITDAKIAIHYLCTEVNRVRAALVSVNGTVINADKPLAMTTDKKVNKVSCSASDWKDTVYLENVSLKKGSNSIIVTGAPAGTHTAAGGASITISDGGYLNYVDYLIVIGKGIDYGTDTTKYFSFNCFSENTTAGDVSSNVAGNVAENSDVTLTATEKEGWQFECWSNGATANPYTFKATTNTIIYAHFIPKGYTAPAAENGYLGYATLTADSKDAKYTITGGAGAKAENKVTLTSFDDITSKYKTLLESNDPAIIKISGTISTEGQTNPLLSVKVNIGSNKTIYGDPSNQGRLRNIGIVIKGENVIVRNMIFGEVVSWDKPVKSGADDAFSLNEASHVWVDHCEFQSHLEPQNLDGSKITSGDYYSTEEKWAKDFYDGLFDVKNGSSWITISNCYFHDHWKACLCASGDDGPDKNTTTGATDEDMRVTFYHNHWENINARMPLFRYGTGHIYDCYFDAGTQSGSASCINVRAGSKLYIEGNTFANFSKTTGDSVSKGSYIIGFFFADTSKAYGTVSGSWVAINNSIADSNEGSVSAPNYTYTAPTSYPTSAPNDVGVGKLTASDLNY